MNLQQVVQTKASSNGFGRRKIERDTGSRFDSKMQNVKTDYSMVTSVGRGGYDTASRERIVYLTTCLLGHHVEVQVQDGSIYSGIFHATNAEKDFGIVLKMARLVKEVSRGKKNFSDSVSKSPSKTLIIPGNELAQVIAKGVPMTMDGLKNELQHQKERELMIDSYISQSRQFEAGRELERWVPDDDAPDCPELDNIFDGRWNRGWDQFEVNETLFGVKSTFDEELYTTKLEKGPQMRELEREALRIAREIEGEETHDLHLAEERGIQLNENLEIDEETKFSSVVRRVDDSGYDDCEDILLDSCNIETFRSISGSVDRESLDETCTGKSNDADQVSSRSSLADDASLQSSTGRESYQSVYSDNSRPRSAEYFTKSASSTDDSRFAENQLSELVGSNSAKEDISKQELVEEARALKLEDPRQSMRSEKESSDRSGLSPNAIAYTPSGVPGKSLDKSNSTNESSEAEVSSAMQGTSHSSSSRAGPSSSSSTSNGGGAAPIPIGPSLSPSSSVGSMSSEKSTLNPYAKEFKLNPNAKSFVPSQTPLRPASPVAEGSFYYPANMTAGPHIHGMPVGIGPVLFNPQAAPTPQPYFHPNGPQYGQQMMLGHPRQVLYMPTYAPDVPYKGREF